MRTVIRTIASAVVAVLCAVGPALAHPHVWVDGGVEFAMRDDATLDALQVTWLYDEFETLYMIAEAGMGLNAAGVLDEADRSELVRQLSDWPEDFDGSAHLTIDGQPVLLNWPEGLDVQVVDGRLQLTFLRPLASPTSLSGRKVQVAFYESTFFFAFSVTKKPSFAPAGDACAAQVTRFDPETAPAGLMTRLAALDHEETPEIEDVGALFADRISVTCD